MSLLQSGKIFNDGEQLTAGKLNQILSDATLSTSGVDGSTIIVNQNDSLAVRSGGIGSSSLATNSVITDKIKDLNVTTGKLKDQSVTTNKINDYDVTTIKIKDLNVTTGKLADGSVTADKLATTALTAGALESAYPVGSVYMNMTSNVDPSTFLGFGSWSLFSQGTLLAGFNASDGSFDKVGYGQNTSNRVGTKTVTLDISQIPSHDHVPNRNTYGTNNLLLRRNVNGENTSQRYDTTPGEPDISGLNLGMPQAEGGGLSHENMPPYFVVYMWRRVS